MQERDHRYEMQAVKNELKMLMSAATKGGRTDAS
jgi:hypothetical protein